MSEPGSPAETEHSAAFRAQSLSVAVEREDDAIVLAVSGDVDMLTAPRLAEAIEQAWREHPRVVVTDLAQVDFLASAGLAVLVWAHHRAGSHGAELRVVCGNRVTFRPIHLTGIDEEIAVYDSRQDALDGHPER